MNDAEVSKQVQQMVRFIKQEAEEKANEIAVSAEEEFNIEKLQIVEAEKRKVKQEYERKEKQLDIRKRIDYSMQLNASRLKVLQAQDDLVQGMKEAAEKELASVSQQPHLYKKLLKELVVQGLLRLREPSILLRCRENDVDHIFGVLEDAKSEFMTKAKVEQMNIHVDDQKFLPPSKDGRDTGYFCSGGIVLASKDGRIVCENTLDARLGVVFKKKLPEIRSRLFGGTGA